MKSNFTITEENYIKTIYHLHKINSLVTTNQLAESLQTKAASITDMLKKLKAKKILNYEKYKGFSLSKEGEKIALNIVRKHRLWEFFLVNTLNFGWDEVHEVAEELEHISSQKLVDKLDVFLGFPKFDPHGDPIPDTNGKITNQEQISLLNLPIQQQAVVSAVGSQSSSLLALLNHMQIKIGTIVLVQQKFIFDNSIEIQLSEQKPITISQQLAETLFVKKVNTTA